MANRPTLKPQRPWFSSGPTAKRPGWSSQAIPQDLLGRGIRAPEVVERFAYGLRQTQALLQGQCGFVRQGEQGFPLRALGAGVGEHGASIGTGPLGRAGAGAGEW